MEKHSKASEKEEEIEEKMEKEEKVYNFRPRKKEREKNVFIDLKLKNDTDGILQDSDIHKTAVTSESVRIRNTPQY